MCLQSYFSDSPCELNNKLATPLFATLEERKGLPPALVVGKSDLLRDEIEAYADKLCRPQLIHRLFVCLGLVLS